MTTRTGPASGGGVVNSIAPWSAAAHHSPDAASLGAPYGASAANVSSATAGTTSSAAAPGFVGRGGIFRSDVPPSTTQAVRALADRFVDGLCFGSAFSIDTDFQVVTPQEAHAKEAAVAQQARRVDDQFRVKAASPDLLAMVLDDLFRIDAVTVASTGGAANADAAAGGAPPPNVIDAMTDVTARIFKKEMKQRIHDWEGAFRTLHGRETMPADKNRLRHIYELYKVVKNRVQRPSTTGGPGGAGGDAARAGGSAVGGGAAASAATGASSAPAASGGTAAAATTAGSSSGGATTTLPHIVPNAAAGGGERRDSGAAPRSASAPGQRTTGATSGAAAASASGGASRPAARTQTPGPTGSSGTTGAAAGASHDALLAEKKQLKRRLHAFETEFARNNGRAPGREDRFPLLAEYQRYGELKTQLAAYGGGD